MIDIIKNGSKAPAAGPADYFTGSVTINAPFQATEPARVGGATSGQGWVQEWDKEVQAIA